MEDNFSETNLRSNIIKLLSYEDYELRKNAGIFSYLKSLIKSKLDKDYAGKLKEMEGHSSEVKSLLKDLYKNIGDAEGALNNYNVDDYKSMLSIVKERSIELYKKINELKLDSKELPSESNPNPPKQDVPHVPPENLPAQEENQKLDSKELPSESNPNPPKQDVPHVPPENLPAQEENQTGQDLPVRPKRKQVLVIPEKQKKAFEDKVDESLAKTKIDKKFNELEGVRYIEPSMMKFKVETSHITKWFNKINEIAEGNIKEDKFYSEFEKLSKQAVHNGVVDDFWFKGEQNKQMRVELHVKTKIDLSEIDDKLTGYFFYGYFTCFKGKENFEIKELVSRQSMISSPEEQVKIRQEKLNEVKEEQIKKKRGRPEKEKSEEELAVDQKKTEERAKVKKEKSEIAQKKLDEIEEKKKQKVQEKINKQKSKAKKEEEKVEPTKVIEPVKETPVKPIAENKPPANILNDLANSLFNSRNNINKPLPEVPSNPKKASLIDENMIKAADNILKNHKIRKFAGKQVAIKKTPVSKQDLIKTFIETWKTLFGQEPAKEELATILAQSGIETGNGQGMLNYNLGMITTSDKSSYNYFEHPDSIGQKDGTRKKYIAKFRAFNSLQEGVTDYLKFISSGRYKPAFDQAVRTGNPELFANLLAKAHYYDPTVEKSYTGGLRRIYNQYMNSNEFKALNLKSLSPEDKAKSQKPEVIKKDEVDKKIENKQESKLSEPANDVMNFVEGLVKNISNEFNIAAHHKAILPKNKYKIFTNADDLKKNILKLALKEEIGASSSIKNDHLDVLAYGDNDIAIKAINEICNGFDNLNAFIYKI